MKIKSNNKSLLLALPLILFMPVVHADLGISLDLNNEVDRYKKNKKSDINAALDLGIEYKGDKFNIDKGTVSYDFSNGNNFAIEAILKSNNNGFDSNDRDIFKGLSGRRNSIDIGARAIAKTKYGPIVMELTRDFHASKGHEADVRFGGIAPHSNYWTGKREVTIAPLVGVRYQNKKVVDYHYGVKNSEATSNRKQYTASSTKTPYVGVESKINISKHFSLNADVVYERRDKSIRNSSLTSNKDHDVEANIGLTYWF